jgi:nucleotide-binding universal stress UspA family protein
MLRSLLVPLDGSNFSERSLPLAGQIARATGATLHLAHVHVPYEPDQLLSNTQFHFEGVDMTDYDNGHREQERAYLTGLAAKVGEDGTPVDAKLLEGREVADELVTYANEVETDMILMTSHGYSGFSRLWLGSVADEMIRRSTLPLLVIHPGEGEGELEGVVSSVGHILIPLDGSKLAESVLGPAADLATATGARITLAHALSVPEGLGPRILSPVREKVERDLGDAREYLEATAEVLRQSGLEVATHAATGRVPAVAIASFAKQLDANVIALATHGYGGLRRTLLGSVADKLLRVSEVPLLVMRPAAMA